MIVAFCFRQPDRMEATWSGAMTMILTRDSYLSIGSNKQMEPVKGGAGSGKSHLGRNSFHITLKKNIHDIRKLTACSTAGASSIDPGTVKMWFDSW